MKKIIYSIALLLGSMSAQAQISPNKNVQVTLSEEGLAICYWHHCRWERVATLPISGLKPGKVTSATVKYTMPLGKKAACTNKYRQCVYTDAQGQEFTVRVYNDGVAWQAPHTSTIDLSTATNHWLMQWSDGYEGFFPKNRSVKRGLRVGYPALFEYTDGTFALITESGMDRQYAACSMHATSPTTFEIRPEGHEQGAWQTIIIGSLSDVVESTLVTDNSQPCRLDDTKWIEPGVASWVYWAYNHGSNDYDIIKKYTDMAVALHLPYVLIDAEWDEMKNGKTVEDAVRYAVERGVKPMLWYNSCKGWINGAPGPKWRLNKPEDREREFAWCEKIGVKGIKIDFFGGDNNDNIAYMVDLLECAARHHLLVNFHGATIPRGWQRTYPNLVSTEGVYGAEWYNNVPTFTQRAACHNATLPFTRNVVGSMDYTPCAFTDSQHPHITTHAHELALTALYESGIQHLADRPESFLSQPQPVKDYLTHLPTAWDETHLLSGYPGESVVMARRKGTTWYIAGINGTDAPRTLTIPLHALKKLGNKVTLFEDSADKANPWKITTSTECPTSLPTSPRGGFVAKIEK